MNEKYNHISDRIPEIRRVAEVEQLDDLIDESIDDLDFRLELVGLGLEALATDIAIYSLKQKIKEIR